MNNSNIIMYTTEDGLTKIETTFEDDTVWLSLDQIFYTLVNCVHNLTYYFLSLFCSKKLTNSYTNKRLSNTIWTFLCFKKAIYTFANFLCKLFSKADCCTDCQGCYLSHIRTHHFALRIHIYINLMSAKYIAIIISYSIGTILIHKDVFHAFF